MLFFWLSLTTSFTFVTSILSFDLPYHFKGGSLSLCSWHIISKILPCKGVCAPLRLFIITSEVSFPWCSILGLPSGAPESHILLMVIPACNCVVFRFLLHGQCPLPLFAQASFLSWFVSLGHKVSIYPYLEVFLVWCAPAIRITSFSGLLVSLVHPWCNIRVKSCCLLLTILISFFV